MNLNPEQQISLITALLGADLTLAAILFGVLGFVYAVFGTLAQPKLPDEPVKDMRVPILPHPLLIPLTRVAQWILAGLFLSTGVAAGCFVWFLYPSETLLICIAAALFLEVVLLFGIGAFVVYSLMSTS